MPDPRSEHSGPDAQTAGPGESKPLDNAISEQTVAYDTSMGLSGSTGEGSLRPSNPKVPPIQIVGYEFERFLGNGSYGEVWTAIQINTKRRVAIKFYTHQSQNLDSLTQEVEKLSLLFSDQNMVQLLEVGWNAEVPYYIMEYLENGSLAEAISEKKLTLDDSVEIFGELLEAMQRAHQKGIIHCDLKPGNILMDQNREPRIADFGQSRLSSEMAPALGTLFYMPPEQTQLNAHPDVRWDVYALGAIFYTMLMGHPPYYTPYFVEKIQEKKTLASRLNVYRRLIFAQPVPVDTRQLRGMLPPMAQIIEKCLQPDPKNRFQSLDELLEAWKICQKHRATFPMYILGAIMPIVILICGLLGVSREVTRTLQEAQEVLMQSSIVSGRFAAEAVARDVEAEVMRRYRIVIQIAENWQFRELVQKISADPEWLEITQKLGDHSLSEENQKTLQNQFLFFPKRIEVQQLFEKLLPSNFRMGYDYLYFCDANGIFTAQIPGINDIGVDFMPYVSKDHTLKAEDSLAGKTMISKAYQHPTTHQWVVSISVPVLSAEEKPKFLGFVFIAVNFSRLVNIKENSNSFATLVDQRPGEMQGLILEHPLYHKLTKNGKPLPDELLDQKYRVTKDRIPYSLESAQNYTDPLSEAPQAKGQYSERWLASCADVNLDIGSGAHWLVISQKSYEHTIGSTFRNLERHFWYVTLIEYIIFLVIIEILWYLVYSRFILDRKPH